jgi:hypothetical protein
LSEPVLLPLPEDVEDPEDDLRPFFFLPRLLELLPEVPASALLPAIPELSLAPELLPVPELLPELPPMPASCAMADPASAAAANVAKNIRMLIGTSRGRSPAAKARDNAAHGRAAPSAPLRNCGCAGHAVGVRRSTPPM